jgi:glycosyltransferase involved in cell wall biosynthesis
MLSFEPGIMSLYGMSRERLRLLVLKYVQARSLKSADGAIFLTEYAAKVIQQYSGPLKRFQIIPHGVGKTFLETETQNRWKRNEPSLPFRCVYVSNTDLYKNQWNVARAIDELRMRGYDCKLQLIGGGDGQGQELLESVLRRVDPAGEHIEQLPFLPQDRLPDILGRSDIAIFASSCENMPNTLLEAMAIGLPIVSSNKGPMPEVLENAGVYCDPLDPQSIADGIERIIVDPQLAKSLSKAARARASEYSWARCAKQTWQFLSNTYRQISSTA